jgi:hypothetical protein
MLNRKPLQKKRGAKPDPKALADQAFSLFIRIRDANYRGIVLCATCNSPVYWYDAHCGHWKGRNHLPTRFDENNCNTQCSVCNMNSSPEIEKKHENYIRWKHGQEIVDKLNVLAHTTTKYMGWEYVEIAKMYWKKAKDAAALKGLVLSNNSLEDRIAIWQSTEKGSS